MRTLNQRDGVFNMLCVCNLKASSALCGKRNINMSLMLLFMSLEFL